MVCLLRIVTGVLESRINHTRYPALIDALIVALNLELDHSMDVSTPEALLHRWLILLLVVARREDRIKATVSDIVKVFLSTVTVCI
jgi:hypothetical protein